MEFDENMEESEEMILAKDVQKKVETMFTKELERLSKGRYLLQLSPKHLLPSGCPTVVKCCSDLEGYKVFNLEKTTKVKEVEDLLAQRIPGKTIYLFPGRCSLVEAPEWLMDRSIFVPTARDFEPWVKFEPYEFTPFQDCHSNLSFFSFVNRGCLLYEVNVVDREEYKIPDWVEEEDEKSKGKKDAGKQKPKKEKKKQPAKQINKQKNDYSKEENHKPQEDNLSSGDTPTPQLELDNFDEAEWVTVGSSKPRKIDLLKPLKEPTPVANKIVKPENQVLKDENAALKERLRRLETEMQYLKTEETAWDAEVGHFFAGNRQENDSDDETIYSTMTKWASQSSLAISESVSKIGRRKVIPKVYPSGPRHKPKEYVAGGSGRYNPITGKVEYPKPPIAPQPEF